MRRDRLIRNIRRLLCTAIIPVLFVGCAQPEPPPADPVELELAGLTVHQRAALAVASAFPPPDGAGADQLWAELATGAAGAVVIAASRLPEAAALLDSLRSTAPLPILVVVEVDQVLPGAQLCRPGRGDGSAVPTLPGRP